MEPPASVLPSIAPKTLLLPGNEVISLLEPTPLVLPPILPSIVKPPQTPRTLRRHLTIQELLRSPIRRTTKKKGKKECTRDDRLRIQSYYDAGLTVKQILAKLPNLIARQVYYVLQHQVTPQRKARGRRLVLSTLERKQLIEWVTTNKLTRRTQWAEIPASLGWNCGVEAISNAIDREGYRRFLA